MANEAPNSAVDTKLQQAVVDKFQTVAKTIQAKAANPGEAKSMFDDIMNLPPDEQVKTIFEMADRVAIKDLKANDKSFNAAAAAASGFSSTALLGIPQVVAGAGAGFAATGTAEGAGQGISDALDRQRLLAKAYPGTSTASQIGGLIKGPGAGLFSAGSNTGKIAALKGTQLIAKLGGEKALQSKLAQVVTQHFVLPAAEAAGGVAAYETASAGVQNAAQVATGDKTVDKAAADTAKAGLEAAQLGAEFGGAFGAGGYLAAKTAQVATKTGKVGADFVARHFLGKDIKYQIENIELFQQVLKSTPSAVIAESADKIAPAAKRYSDKLKVIESEAKNEILNGLGNQKLKLEGALASTAKDVDASVSKLRQAAEGDIAQSARQLMDNVGAAYSAKNAEYGKALEPIISGPTKFVNMNPVLEGVQKELTTNGAMNAKGTLQPGSAWAQANPEAFAELSNVWGRFGGVKRLTEEVKQLNVNLADVLNFKKELGAKANFGQQATNFERVLRNVFFDVKRVSEIAEPQLKQINAAYTSGRAKIDTFRSVVGKTEQSIALKLRRNLLDNKNVFITEGLSGLGDAYGKAKGPVEQALSSSDKLNLISQFKKDPKGVFGQIRDAYVNDNTFMIDTMESMAQRFPELKGPLQTAKTQAQIIKNMPSAAEARAAVSNPEMARGFADSIPGVQNAASRLEQTAAKRKELGQVLPADRVQLEQALGNNNFGASPIQQGVIQDVQAQSPEIAQPLQNAEAARTAQRLQSGDIQQSAIEQIPIFGQTIFALRKASTPIASNLLNAMARSSPKMRRAMLSDLFDRVRGTQQINKAAIVALQKEMGPEAALVMYAQNGGQYDLQAAADELARDLSQEHSSQQQ